VTTIAKYQQVSDEDTKKIVIAAWFHDTGYIVGTDNHEVLSVEIATAFLKKQNCDNQFISDVSSLILATVFNHHPKNELEQIIRDADYFHFASENYLNTCELLR